jgi:DNA-binding NarL/FixJ family response regulator
VAIDAVRLVGRGRLRLRERSILLTLCANQDNRPVRSLSVLLVEDSRLLADRLRESILIVPGAELAGTVDSESDAVAMLKRRPVDVVLLDLHLHSGTGFGVLRVINSGEVGKVLAIILTNYDLGEYRRAAAALGARYFLDKLRDFDRLPGLLQQIRADIDEAPERALQVGCA